MTPYATRWLVAFVRALGLGALLIVAAALVLLALQGLR